MVRAPAHPSTLTKTQQYLLFLSTLSKELAVSLDYQTTLDKVGHMLVPHFADWCEIDMIDQNGEAELFSIYHQDPSKARWAKKIRMLKPVKMSDEFGVANVLKTGQPKLYSKITDEMLKLLSPSKRAQIILKSFGLRSGMIVPLVGRKKVLGAITFVATKESERIYEKDDLAFAEEVAGRVGMAIENIRLYEQAQQELERHRQVELELRKSESRFQRLMDSSILGIIIADLNGELIDSNDAFLEMVGYTRAELKLGKIAWTKMTPSEYYEADAAAIQELFEHGECAPYEKEYIRKDGSRLPVLIGVARLEESEDTCVAFVLDNSERKKLEERKDEFIGVASHELKTPLTSIKGLVQIIQKKYRNTPDRKLGEYLTKVNTQLDRLKELVGSLLDVSVIESGQIEYKREQLNISEVIRETVEEIQLTTDTHHLIVKGKVTQKVLADRYRIHQVLTNLINNAIKYSPDANKVEIELSGSSKQVTVKVRDFGNGVPRADQKKIFERFYRADNTNHYVFGLGLGLYITAEIIRRHKGRIWLDSPPGAGATFCFSLPVTN